MTIRPRVVRALRNARERLRDAAAASHATATSALERRGEELSESCDRLEAFLDDASATLSSVRTVHDIDRIAEVSGAYRLDVADAKARHDAANLATEATADTLRERTRQLRSIEKVVAIVDEYYTKRELRTEQLANDDLASSARKR